MTAFAKFAMRLLDSGYSPIPIAESEKRPLIKQWNRLRSAAMTPDEVENMAWRRPSLGLGVAGGFGGLVPIDVDAEDTAVLWAICGALPVPIVGKRGRRGFTVFYHSAGNIPAMKFRHKDKNVGMLAEVLSTGAAIIPPTKHPDTGKPYRWTSGETLFDVSAAGLSELTPDHIEALRMALKPWMAEPKRYEVPSSILPVGSKRQAAYARAALANEARELAAMGRDSGRNHRLFQAGCKIGKWVHHNVLSAGEVQETLMGACRTNGLLKDDGMGRCMASLKSGLGKAAGDRLEPMIPGTDVTKKEGVA